VTVTLEQLAFFAENGHGGNGTMTKAEAGLAKEIPPGAERLLGELAKRGLRSEDLRVAAMLVLALEEWAT
jgi:hypothetical protein